MARFAYQGTSKDGNGRVIPSMTVSVFLAGTITVADVYTASSGGSAVNSVTSDSTDGSFKFWVDTADYSSSQQFKITLSKTDFTPKTYDDIRIYPFFDLNDLDDVEAGSPTNNQSLTWDSVTSKWIPETVSAGGGGSQNLFETIACPAGSNPVADEITDTLTLAVGSNKISITGDAPTDKVTFDVVQGNIDHGSLSGLGDNDHSVAGGWTDDGTVVRLTTATDKVGINELNPAAALEVTGGNILVTRNSGDTGSAAIGLFQDNVGANGQWVIASRNASNLGFRNVGLGADALTITSAGDASFIRKINLTSMTNSSPVNGDIWYGSGDFWGYKAGVATSLTSVGALNDLTDVNAGTPSNNDALTWDSVTSKWIPEAVSGGGGAGQWEDAGTYIRPLSPSIRDDTVGNEQLRIYDSGTTQIGQTPALTSDDVFHSIFTTVETLSICRGTSGAGITSEEPTVLIQQFNASNNPAGAPNYVGAALHVCGIKTGGTAYLSALEVFAHFKGGSGDVVGIASHVSSKVALDNSPIRGIYGAYITATSTIAPTGIGSCFAIEVNTLEQVADYGHYQTSLSGNHTWSVGVWAWPGEGGYDCMAAFVTVGGPFTNGSREERWHTGLLIREDSIVPTDANRRNEGILIQGSSDSDAARDYTGIRFDNYLDYGINFWGDGTYKATFNTGVMLIPNQTPIRFMNNAGNSEKNIMYLSTDDTLVIGTDLGSGKILIKIDGSLKTLSIDGGFVKAA